MFKRIKSISDVFLLLLAIGTFLPLLSGVFWLFELPAHLKSHMAIFALFLSIYAIFKKHVLFTFVAILLLILNSYVFLPHFSQGKVPDPTLAVRVLSVNVNWKNQKYENARQVINNLSPDIIGVLETTPEWKAQLNSVSSQYNSYYHESPGDNNLGMAIMSRFPIDELKLLYLSDDGYPTLSALITINELPVRVLIVHPPPPRSADYVRIRNEQFDAIAEIARNSPQIIVLGDFNSTPWAGSFRRLTRGNSMKLTSSGFAYATTWPTQLSLLGMPIDHIMISQSMGVVRHEAGRDIGSDHRPVYADIVVRRR